MFMVPCIVNSSRGIQIRLVVGKFVLVVFKFVCTVLWVIAVDFPCALLQFSIALL